MNTWRSQVVAWRVGTGVSVRVVARTDGLHLIEQSQVMTIDVANLVLRIQIMFRIGNST